MAGTDKRPAGLTETDGQMILLRGIQLFVDWVVTTGPKPEYGIEFGSQADSDGALLSLASLVTGPRDGMAVRYLNNFLAGAPINPMTFSCATMLVENPGIKKKVIAEVAGSARLGIKSSKEAKSPVVIQQSDYMKGTSKGREWWGAIGSFRFDWKINASSTKARTVVQLWGEDEYRWHPEDDRWTKAVHEAATRLQSSRGAKPFKVIGMPAAMVVNTGEIIGT